MYKLIYVDYSSGEPAEVEKEFETLEAGRVFVIDELKGTKPRPYGGGLNFDTPIPGRQAMHIATLRPV